MNDLVQRLTQEQEIEASLRPEPTVQAFKAAIDRGYVHAKFPNTRGGTELGIPLDRERSDLSGADFENGQGSVRIVGELVLDYTKVRFHGVIDLATFKGTGRLEPLED
ncbi:MAG TPA: MbtH domain protein [Thermoanaerobaculia bacterium]